MALLPLHDEATVSEYRTATGELQPVYEDLMASLDGLGEEGMVERWRKAKREVELDAFSFALDPKEFRPVPTDWIPRIIDIEEWRIIKAGVEQRLKALNCFLLDLYDALRPLDAITGATTMDDILDRIFSSFCIGK